MKKLLVLLGSIGLTSTASIGVVSCGVNNQEEVVKVDLKTLNLDELIGIENMSPSQALTDFLSNQTESLDLAKSVEISSFIAPYGRVGKLEVKATAEGKYDGMVEVNVPEVKQINLDTLGLKTLLTDPVSNQEAAFDSFIKLNFDINDLAANLEIISYTASDYDQVGTLVIQAKPNTKYFGTLTITIPEQHKTNLDMWINNRTIQGTLTMTDDEAFQAFLEVNSSWTNLSDYVDYSSYKSATYQENGSLTITAKPHTMYTGQITITIVKLEQVDLNTLEINPTIGIAQDANQEDAFNVFLVTNQDILGTDLTLNQVQLSAFQPPKIAQNGSLTITVKSGVNSKYMGTITIETQYLLDENNISDTLHYLSDHKLLNFNIPTGFDRGSSGSSLLALVIKLFRESMVGLYQYGPNIETISMYNYSQAPNQNQMNTKGYVWTPTGNAMNIAVEINFNDGRNFQDITISGLFITMTMV